MLLVLYVALLFFKTSVVWQSWNGCNTLGYIKRHVRRACSDFTFGVRSCEFKTKQQTPWI